MFSSDDPVAGQATIFWDVDMRFATQQQGGQAPLHHFIALLHELGHAVQWLENPVFFNGNMMHGTAGAVAIKNAATAFFRRKAQGQGIGAYGAQTAFAQQYTGVVAAHVPRAWAVRVEMDNLMRHEWPICDEAGFARRLGYTDLLFSYDFRL